MIKNIDFKFIIFVNLFNQSKQILFYLLVSSLINRSFLESTNTVAASLLPPLS
jgi:hypothetical protein